MEPDIGIEPMTYSLQNCRSTAELIRQMAGLLGLEPKIPDSNSGVLPITLQPNIK